MTDRAELELVIASQVDRVLAGLSSFERSLNQIEKAHVTTGQQAQVHGQKVEEFTGKMSRLADVGKLFAAWEIIERVMGSFKGLEKFNTDLLHTTQLLGGNAEAASTWSAIASVMDIDIGQVDRAFAKLSTNLNSGASPALKQMGIAGEDAHGKLRPLNDVVNQAADYFHAHAGAVNNAALANELFGRGGYQLLPILEQGSAGLAAFTAEARKYGLILDAETIQRNAAFTFQLKEAELAGRGLAVTFGNTVLPGLAAFGQALSRVIADNLPAFIAGVQRAVSYLIGFVEAFAGVTLSVDQGAMALGEMSGMALDTGSAMEKSGAAAAAFAERERQVRDAARDTTNAIDDQIRSLNAQVAATQFADKQDKLNDQVASKEKDVQRLREDQYREFWLGNFQNAKNIADQIVAAKAQEEDLKLQITRSSEENATKLRISGLEAQKRSVNDGAQAQIEAIQRAAAAGSAAVGGMAAGFAPTVAAGSAAAAEKFKFAMDASAEATGLSMGKKLQDALFGPQIWVDSDRKIAGHFERSGGQGFTAIGTAIGDAIATGLTTALGRGVQNWWNNTFIPGLARRLKNIAPGGGGVFADDFARQSGNLSFGGGGIVPGPRGASVFPVEVHGGEVIQTPEQAAAGMDETNGLLRQLIALIAAGQSSGGAGTAAAISELMERVATGRRRGMVGSYAR
jgi:hypothetical protein